MFKMPFARSKDTTTTEGFANGHSIVDLRNVNKFYKTAVGDYPALKNINLQINAGEFVSIIGKSGSGKSSLLNMITGIDHPTNGEVFVNGTAVHKMGEDKMARWRGNNLGIEIASWLIRDNQGWVIGEGACDRDALLLSS